MAHDIRDIVARTKAILDVGVIMQDPSLDKGDVKAFFVVVKGGPESRIAGICSGAAGILNMTWDVVDGLAPLKKLDRPYLLQPIFHHDPTDADFRNLAESAVERTPGSLIVVPIRGTETDVQDARNTLAGMEGVLATCCFA
jgi:hypothetical protein